MVLTPDLVYKLIIYGEGETLLHYRTAGRQPEQWGEFVIGYNRVVDYKSVDCGRTGGRYTI